MEQTKNLIVSDMTYSTPLSQIHRAIFQFLRYKPISTVPEEEQSSDEVMICEISATDLVNEDRFDLKLRIKPSASAGDLSEIWSLLFAIEQAAK
jgi:hypothetical protein